MSNTELGLLRHGQTDWNINLRLQGTADIPMNEVGISQIEVAADRLAAQSWDLILSSPLGRAMHSAEIVAARLGIAEVQVEPLLLERSFGIGEGLEYSQWHEQYGALDEIPGAESASQVISRANLLLEKVASEYRGRRVLAVSHGALIRFVLSEVSEGLVPPKGERLQNASLHELHHTDIWRLRAWAPNPLGSETLE
ncbi:MAG: hypothetical protein RIS08_942 [Actinomycetota bacterium]|jgi:broad specificity phosphatase PhoE